MLSTNHGFWGALVSVLRQNPHCNLVLQNEQDHHHIKIELWETLLYSASPNAFQTSAYFPLQQGPANAAHCLQQNTLNHETFAYFSLQPSAAAACWWTLKHDCTIMFQNSWCRWDKSVIPAVNLNPPPFFWLGTSGKTGIALLQMHHRSNDPSLFFNTVLYNCFNYRA